MIRQNNKIATGILLILVVILAFGGIAEARTGSNQIASGDLVFVNEENLDVSAILESGLYNELRTLNGERSISVINGGISAVPAVYGGEYPYEFYAYNASMSGNSKYGTGKILVSDLKSLLEGIYIKKNIRSGTSEINADNEEIVSTEDIRYYVRIKTAYSVPFMQFVRDINLSASSGWYEFGYETDGAGYYRTSVKNTDGTEQAVTGANPANSSESAEFRFSMNGLHTGYHTVSVHFKLNLPTIPLSGNRPEYRVSHIVRESGSDDFRISASTDSVQPGYTGLTVSLHGLALSTYTVSVSPESYLTFPEGISSPFGTVIRDSPYHLTVIFEDTAKDIVYPVEVGSSAKRGEYRIVMNDGKMNSKSVRITVNSSERVPSIAIPAAVSDGMAASGDSFKVKIKYPESNAGEVVNLYLRNGAGAETLIRGPVSFDSISEYTCDISTRGFDKGTYSLIARASDGGTARVAFYLAEPTLVVQSNVRETHIVGNDKDLEFKYVARGSPDKLVWYLFGTNFRKSGEIILLPDSTDADSVDARLRSGTLIFTRNELNECADGSYEFLITHPGSDNNFTLVPQYDSAGNFVSVRLPSGAVINIRDRPASNAASAVIENLYNGNSDDLLVQESFEILKEDYLRITGIRNMEVGDGTMTVHGTTSAPAGKTVNLAIIPVSFEPETVSNTAMRMKAGYTAVLAENTDMSARTFTISGISVKDWYPGTYLAEFTIDDPELAVSVSFTVYPDGALASACVNITEPAVEICSTPAASPVPTSSPVPVPTVLPSAHPSPTPTAKNPVMLTGILAGLFGTGILRRRK